MASALGAGAAGAGMHGGGAAEWGMDDVSAAVAGMEFKELFYSVCDSNRSDLWHFFKPHSVCVWNGTAVTGAQIKDFFKAVPPTKHRTTSLDVQPVGGSGLLVTTTGEVTYGLNNTSSAYHHTFVLERDVEADAADAQQGTQAQGGNFYYILSYTARNSSAGAKKAAGGRAAKAGRGKRAMVSRR